MAPPAAVVGPSRPRLWLVLGPGLITGAADDDPSGIATYAQAGAQFGYRLGWTLLFTYPLMVVIQAVSARIGRTTGQGIAGNLREHYPGWLLQSVVALLFVANTLNIGADLGAMAEATRLLLPALPAWAYVVAFGMVSTAGQMFLQHTRYVAALKWLTLSLFAYFATVCVVHVSWPDFLRGLVWPRFTLDQDFWLTVVAILVTAAATLHQSGAHNLSSAAQAAEALRPLAGQAAFALFALGIIGTGLLSVPVLAGSAAYALGEARRWPVGLARRPLQAKAFYTAIAVATLLGATANVASLNPVKALVWAAVINGLVAVPVMALLMLMAANVRIMGQFRITGSWILIGWIATGVMGVAAVAFIGSSL